MKPKHPRFEVEDIVERKNYTFSLEGDFVSLYNTSRGAGNLHMETWGPTDFPNGAKTAVEYYDFLYEKSLDFTNRESIHFLGYVDDKFEPIEE